MKATDALRRIIGLWDSLDAVGSDEPAEPYKEQMDAAVNDARKVLEDAYREAAADPAYAAEMRDLTAHPQTGDGAMLERLAYRITGIFGPALGAVLLTAVAILACWGVGQAGSRLTGTDSTPWFVGSMVAVVGVLFWQVQRPND